MHWKARMAGPTRRRPLRGMVFIGVAVLIGGIAVAAEEAKNMIDNSGFSPEPIAVAAGSTIAWVNRDDIPHSIVAPTLGVRSQLMKTSSSSRSASTRLENTTPCVGCIPSRMAGGRGELIFTELTLSGTRGPSLYGDRTQSVPHNAGRIAPP